MPFSKHTDPASYRQTTVAAHPLRVIFPHAGAADGSHTYAVLMSLSGLPTDLQRAARIDENGEVSWPDDYAASASRHSRRPGTAFSGWTFRFYFGDGTFYEIPWSEADGLQAKTDALDARIDELERPAHAVERRVLVTWE
jgi:hypothetical protein